MGQSDFADWTQHDLVREIALVLAHWPYWVPLALMLMVVGGFGRGLGAPNLFRDDDQIFGPDACWGAPPTPRPPPAALAWVPAWLWRAGASPALWGGFGFLAAFGLFWMAAHAPPGGFCVRDGRQAPCASEIFHDGASGWSPLLLALAAAAAAFVAVSRRAMRRRRADFTQLPPRRLRSETLRVATGLGLGAAFALAAYEIGALAFEAGGRGLALAAAGLPYLGILALIGTRPNALPAVSIASVVIFLILIGVPLSRLGGAWTPILVALAVFVVTWANGRFAKRRLPGFEPLYDTPVNPQERPPKDAPPPPFPAPPLIAPRAALDAWIDRRAGAGPAEKPVLVLLATSGGAYRATFWTSLLMDRLIADSHDGGRWPELAGSVRLLTGASGGMVAGAYFAVLAAQGALAEGVTARISADTLASLADPDGVNRNLPIARDSLSPVVHQLVRRDLPSLLLPAAPATDRGRILDAQWRTLAASFADVAPAERDGRAPSLILSPMLVETGAVAIFANLDLGRLRADASANKASVEIFKAFPAVHDDVSIATAVRLNATFPYVSPAISLPTLPERRPVDAGYYDNYGVDLMTAYLQQDDVLAFAAERCRGVALIQVRAFPSGLLTEKATRLERAFQFLTTPVEGVFAARKSSQMFRIDQQLDLTRRRYDTATREGFMRVFTFEANTDVSMSWYLRCDEMRALSALLDPPRGDELRREDAPPPGAGPAAGPRVSRAEVERWVARSFGGPRADPDATPDAFIRALQAREPEALRAQHLHHRAKTAEEFDALAAFWQGAPRPPTAGAS